MAFPQPASEFDADKLTTAWGPPDYHPSNNENEWPEDQQLGEIAYTQEKFHQALAFLRGARSRLGGGCGAVRTSGVFWSLSPRYLQEEPADPFNMVFCTGLTILTLIGPRRAWLVNRAIAAPYMLVFLLFPVIYYLTHPEDYYRRPIDPQYVVLAARAVASRVAEWK